MIVSFSVVNFRSFAKEQTFSLVASKRFTGSHENHLSPIPDSDEKALRMAVIYGANGAGKSNLFKALSYVKTVALEPRKKNSGTGREVFRLDGLENYVSEFDLQFIAGNKLYRFGFKVDDNRITEEWITRVKGGRESAIYERVTNADGKVTILAKGLKKAGEKVNALATVGGLPNQSFLATVRATLDVSEYGAELDTVFKWFEDSLRLIAPNTRFGNLTQLLSNDPTFLAFASNLLKAASTGVDHLSVLKKEVSEEELRRLLPDNVVSKALSDLQETGMAMFKRTDGFELLILNQDSMDRTERKTKINLQQLLEYGHITNGSLKKNYFIFLDTSIRT
jgi:energy-coupling factor transporter ATP-binding protein EcfA2